MRGPYKSKTGQRAKLLGWNVIGMGQRAQPSPSPT